MKEVDAVLEKSSPERKIVRSNELFDGKREIVIKHKNS